MLVVVEVIMMGKCKKPDLGHSGLAIPEGISEEEARFCGEIVSAMSNQRRFAMASTSLFLSSESSGVIGINGLESLGFKDEGQPLMENKLQLLYDHKSPHLCLQ